MNTRKILFYLTMALFFLVVSTMPALAWQFNLSDVDGTLTKDDAYTMTVEFEGETTDYLDTIFFAIEWNTELLELAAFVEVPTYQTGSGTLSDPYVTSWEPSFIEPEYDMENGLYVNVNGATPLTNMGTFYPEATGETLMATFTFTALESGCFSDMASFYFTSDITLTESVVVNDVIYDAEDGDLQITKNGKSSIMSVSAVPVPAALWLLGSGLLGVLGLRRKEK